MSTLRCTRKQEDMEYLPLHPCFVKESLTKPAAYQSEEAGWSVNPKDLPVSTFPAGLHVCVIAPGVLHDAGDPNPAFMPVKQAFY